MASWITSIRHVPGVQYAALALVASSGACIAYSIFKKAVPPKSIGIGSAAYVSLFITKLKNARLTHILDPKPAPREQKKFAERCRAAKGLGNLKEMAQSLYSVIVEERGKDSPDANLLQEYQTDLQAILDNCNDNVLLAVRVELYITDTGIQKRFIGT
ncbi:hypothetical protein COB21_00360 [Candidatus Aerophobetes bacterium]|uniref:Uncharacterized protein n=1 Tax=Aerophobetes bacterium TaxID=2030807 RepID=A0A2A4X933_UNCAE|nr:MAG: hypothetical protein COB21_00360 [Candidatus Aerophobetes bacterium]